MSIVPPSIKHGNKAETHLAKRLGGRLTPASGAMVHDKADIKVDGFRIESKSTIKDTMRLEYGWFNKVSGEALTYGEIPALAVQFVNGNGTPRRNGSFVMVRERDFLDLMELRKNKDGG
jgi:hypothetical protein